MRPRRGPRHRKEVVLRLLAERLEPLRDVTVGVLTHPQSNLADFYREMGDVFGVGLKPNNRWGGFKALRERWQAHLENTLLRAYSGHRDRLFRSIVITDSGDRDHSSERSDGFVLF